MIQPTTRRVRQIGMLIQNAARQSVRLISSAPRTRAAGHAERADAAPDRHRLRTPLGRKRGEQQTERGGRHEGAADALHGTTRNQHAERRCCRTDRRADREHTDPTEEDTLATDLVGDLAGDDEERSEEDVVDGHDPGHVRAGGAFELAHDLGKGDVDDRQVERGDVGRAGTDREGDPPLAFGCLRPFQSQRADAHCRSRFDVASARRTRRTSSG